jgi:heme/copper-type cytochrome/quinol oxidase subunit 4
VLRHPFLQSAMAYADSFRFKRMIPYDSNYLIALFGGILHSKNATTSRTSVFLFKSGQCSIMLVFLLRIQEDLGSNHGCEMSSLWFAVIYISTCCTTSSVFITNTEIQEDKLGNIAVLF